ncbi:MAG: ATP-binding cassette domain-containing protein [Caldilineaceae bacterium]|nr:ATP-binding cassette domain-containing protein [Caldilineaceae bacterium]
MRIALKPLFQRNPQSDHTVKALPDSATAGHVAETAQTQQPRRDTLGYIIRLFSRHLPGQRKLLLLALLMLVIEATMSIYEEYPLSYLVDFLLGNRSALVTAGTFSAFISERYLTVLLLTITIVVMAMINSLGDSMAEIFLARVGQMLSYNLRTALYKHLQRLSLAFHDQRRTGDILTRITGDVDEVEDFVIGSLSDIVGSLLILAGTLAVLFYTSWQIALLALVIVPMMAVVSNYFSKRIKKAAKTQRACEGELASASQEMLASIRVIQTYSRGDYELNRFAEHNQKNMAAAFRLAVLQARFSWVVSVSQSLATSGTVWLCLWLLDYGAITIGTLVFFTRLIEKMFKPTRKIIKEWNTIAKVYASVERIGELLDRKPTVSDSPNALPAPVFRGHIQFHKVDFFYPANSDLSGDNSVRHQERQALTDVNFAVAPGDVMALVGHTGAGKSTIIQLLPRLYDPTSGRVLIDGADIRNFTLESLRDQISVVLQETTLFTGSVADNIAYGRTDATREDIIQAAIQANAHGFIEKLPNGYDTVLGERGASLSGGQKQRIAIARAFIRNTPILILDEPTTGLDAESAELVLLALRLLMRGKTTIIISHDFKLVRHADNIVVLKEGKIKQTGTHRQLLEQDGIYANLYIKQFGEIKSAEEEGDNSLYDLLQSPEFRHRWSTIGTAFDGDVMQSYLQNVMVGAGNEQYRIVRCKPGKASFLAEEGCVLRYSLQLEHAESKERQAALVLARIFATAEEAEIYVRQRLNPLVAQMRGRPEIVPFAHPVAFIDDLNMAVSVFPIDGELPALIASTDHQQMTEFFQKALGDDGDMPMQIEDCTIEAGHYGRQHRCVLRYEVNGRLRNAANADHGNPQPMQQVVYGKIAADDRCKIVGAVLSSLQWRLRQVQTKRQFRLPRIRGYWPDTGLILLESIPGKPQISEMLQAHIASADAAELPSIPTNLSLTEALQDCARVASALHKVNIQFSETRTFQSELDDLQTYMPAVQQFSLALAMQMQHAMRRLQSYAETTAELPVCFSHGDYTYTQLIFDENTCGLVDFDTVCQAEPALDLGQFLAYMRLAARKAEDGILAKGGEPIALDVDALSEQFVEMYIHTAELGSKDAEQLRARVAAYEIISLMRITLHSWQKMKSSRLEVAAALLEERVAALPIVK